MSREKRIIIRLLAMQDPSVLCEDHKRGSGPPENSYQDDKGIRNHDIWRPSEGITGIKLEKM